MRYSELKRLLRKNKCYDTGEGTRHAKWKSLKTGEIFEIPRHDSQEVPAGTLNAILKKAGIN